MKGQISERAIHLAGWGILIVIAVLFAVMIYLRITMPGCSGLVR